MQIKKPETFEELLNLQKIFDEEVLKPRKNGFIPRERTEQDIIYALDDEIQEWLKELPKELNFKIWKEKEYNREKELEELTDILFFILQLANYKEYFKTEFSEDFKTAWEHKSYYFEIETRNIFVRELKTDLYFEQFKIYIMRDYIHICSIRNFTKQDILNQYWEKWQRNMNERINGDWTLKK